MGAKEIFYGEIIYCRFGHGSPKLTCQAQSKKKTLAKMEKGGLSEKVIRDKVLTFKFTNLG